jgi:3-oxoacyl-[acyl-carrier protein] reductase
MASVRFDFTNSTVIVTGAARGIGLELSRFFADAGAEVWMVDLDAELTAEAAGSVGGVAAPGDVTSSEDVARIVADAVGRTGRIDVVVNNAGLLRDKVLWKLSDEDWHAVVDVSLGGTFRLTRACVPHFRAQNRGRVINISSYTGLHGNVGQAAYAAAKAGVIGFTKTAAKELARFGITVNAIVPNARTRMVESIPDAQREQLERQIPLGRFGEPREMAAAAAFLASDEAAYVTGVVLPVDGGLSM